MLFNLSPVKRLRNFAVSSRSVVNQKFLANQVWYELQSSSQLKCIEKWGLSNTTIFLKRLALLLFSSLHWSTVQRLGVNTFYRFWRLPAESRAGCICTGSCASLSAPQLLHTIHCHVHYHGKVSVRVIMVQKYNVIATKWSLGSAIDVPNLRFCKRSWTPLFSKLRFSSCSHF